MKPFEFLIVCTVIGCGTLGAHLFGAAMPLWAIVAPFIPLAFLLGILLLGALFLLIFG